MAEESRSVTANDFLICRSIEEDDYSVWRIDIQSGQLHPVPGHDGAKFNYKHQLIAVGNYILEWGPITLQDYGACFPYRLFRFDPGLPDPLSISAVNRDGKPTLVAKGTWPKKKFWGTRPDFGNPDGPAKEFDKGEKLMMVPLGTYVLNVIPTPGRGTYKLFYFDPSSSDPLYQFPTWIAGAFETIEFRHELIPLANYVLDYLPSKREGGGSEYWVWSADPMNETPLARPAIQTGRWDHIDKSHRLIAIGEHVLDWDTKNGSYRLWGFNPEFVIR